MINKIEKLILFQRFLYFKKIILSLYSTKLVLNQAP